MAILPFATPMYNTPHVTPFVIQEVINQEKSEKITSQTVRDDRKVADLGEEISSETIQNTTPINTQALSTNEQNLIGVGEVTISQGSSEQYRKVLLAQRLSEALPILEQLSGKEPGSSESLALVVKMRRTLESSWEIIKTGDRNMALFIRTLEGLFDKDYWKKFDKDDLNKITERVSSFIDTKEIPNAEETMSLIPSKKVRILPSIQ